MDASLRRRGLLALSLLALAGGCGQVEPVPKQSAEPPPLAIKGYDPVAYFTVGPGKAELEYEWDEQRYRFATAENMARFKTDPGRYAPRFGNNCAGALAFGLAFPADPDIWRIHEGRLYIFGSTGSRDIFDKNPTGVIAAAARNYERQRHGQQLVPEIPLPASTVDDIKSKLERCGQDAGAYPDCAAFLDKAAEIKRFLDAQPRI